MAAGLRSSYAGEFDAELALAGLSRRALCVLGREYLLIGHLQDRVGLPLAIQLVAGDAYVRFAIDEWMSASPIYTRRVQEALGFGGDDVGTVFKNLQLDIGAPHQFMDFQFLLESPEYGEFWLPHCGALLDVEPFGEGRVKLMCHDIEDPTFDATAAAVNPRMKMRPIHRPPRVPADRYPHCRWSVFVDAEATPCEQHPNLSIIQASRIATVPVDVPEEDAEPGGWRDYSGPFDPGFQLEDLSHRALVVALQEVAVQIHLLARAFVLCAAQRAGDDTALELGRRQWIGAAALGAQRLKRALAIEGDGIDAVAKVFQLHPHFHPRSYVDLRVEVTGERSALVGLGDCAALREKEPYGWLAGLGAEPHAALDAIAGAVNPRASCRPATPPDDAALAWEIEIDPGATPREDPAELALARVSRGASFEMEPRRPLRD